MTPRIFWHFLLHILVAAVLFIVVAAVAIFLWYCTVLMEKYGVPDTIRIPCYYLAEGLFFVDAVSLVFVLAVEVVKFVRDVWHDGFGDKE